jgi:ABC-type uncharacterized transport system YnjBCD ATPase subunit
MFEKLGGRKMVAATLTVAVGIGMALAKDDIPPNLLYLLISVFGLFAGSNSINTMGSLSLEKKKLDTTIKEAPQAGIPVQDAVEAFAQLSSKVEAAANEQMGAIKEVVKSAQLTQSALAMIAEKVLSK